MEDARLIDCGGMVVGGGEAFVTFNPRRPFNFYWNNNCIILPKSVDLPQVSASYYKCTQTELSLCFNIILSKFLIFKGG